MDLGEARSLFPATAELTYLDTATMALGNSRSATAIAAVTEQWTAGTFSWVEAEQVGEELRATVARLLGARAEEIAFVTGASGGAATIAAQLPDGRDVANVVVPAREFASNFLAWQLLQDRGYELRMVDDIDGALPVDAFAEWVDRDTAIIATSVVQSATGYRVDLDGLKTLAADSGAWLVVDASQAFGGLAIDIAGIDALFCCTHKWLLGTRGIGHLYLRPDLRDRFVPTTPGWKSTADPVTTFYGPAEFSSTASKLDASWGWINPIADIEAIRIIEAVGLPTIEAHNLALVEQLDAMGLDVPFEPARRSPIVTLAVSDADALAERLESARIAAAVRAGRVRLSLHLYNTAADLDRLACELG